MGVCKWCLLDNGAHPPSLFCCQQCLWWGIEETFEDLFVHLQCASNYNGKPKVDSFVAVLLDYVKYDPGESPSSIGLYGGK